MRRLRTVCAAIGALSALVGVAGCSSSENRADQEVPREEHLSAAENATTVATWSVDDRAHLSRRSTAVPVRVLRTACADGDDGKVVAHRVVETDEKITVTFRVSPFALGPDEAAACVGTRGVAYVLRLEHPLGSRQLVDGVCADHQDLGGTVFCESTDVRWPRHG